MLKKTKFCLRGLSAFFISCLLIFGTAVNELYAEALSKQQQRDQLAEEIDAWADGLGYPLDEGIKETVIVLNLLGFTTNGSCEGHLNWGCAYPWVDFSVKSPEGQAIETQIDQIYLNGLRELMSKYPELTFDELFGTPEGEEIKPMREKLYVLLDALYDLYNDIARSSMKPLLDLIDQFYQDHDVAEDQKLHIFFSNDIIRLVCQGWDVQDKRVGEEREYYLKLNQQEMMAFTEFLKEIYFLSPS